MRSRRGCTGKSSAPWAVMGMATRRETAASFAWLWSCCGQSHCTGTLVLAGVAVRVYQLGISHADRQVFAAECNLA